MRAASTGGVVWGVAAWLAAAVGLATESAAPLRSIGEILALPNRLMAGRQPDRWEIVVEPSHVVTRQSTDVLAIEDRDVALAVQFIRERATSGITVQDVLAAVPVSRRTLESRFRQFLGRSPHAEILRTRLDHVKTLLASTDLPMPRVAEAAGFGTPEYMACVFRREIGIRPGEYRRKHRDLARSSSPRSPGGV
jgi:LacI family transcriptional regulator